MKEINVQKLKIGNDLPFTLIAGLNVLESDQVIEEVVVKCIEVAKKFGIPFIFKASYDKANRSSVNSYRGPGVEDGLKTLLDIKLKYEIPVLSDVHTINEVELAKDILDFIQIPAFLCRQTDLVEALARTGLPVNIKKAQFMSPSDIENVIRKFESFGNDNLVICERGTSFGYNNLVVDMLGITKLKLHNYPVIFDVTHSLQQPGGLGEKTGGRRENVLDLAKSGMALGLAGLFLETHPDPDNALCDGPCALPLSSLEEFIFQVKSVDDLVKSLPKIVIK